VFEIEDVVGDQRMRRPAVRRIRLRTSMAPLIPEANLAMKTCLRQLTTTLGMPMSRTDIDNLVSDLRGSHQAALMYCAFVDAAILGEDTPDNLGAAQALLSRMPNRARHDVNLDDYEKHRESLVKHLLEHHDPEGRAALVDARD
jgi:hypothetical protein